MPDNTSKIKSKAGEVLVALGFSGDVIISQRDTAILINYQLEEPSILIGRNGEVLEALQHVLRLLVGNFNEGRREILVVDINGYRKKRTQIVEKIARESAHKARQKAVVVELEPMNSYERRIVHTIVGMIADVESESTGERQNRRVKIRPKKSNL